MRKFYHFSIIFLITLTSMGCDVLAGYNADISKYTQAIEKAKNNIELAEAYSKRGAAFSEKARYSRFRKIVTGAEYQQIFDQAINDHNQAISLSPKTAKYYYERGVTNYNRAAVINASDEPEQDKYFNLAKLDFDQATILGPDDPLAYDWRGLIFIRNKDYDHAIEDFTQVLRLNEHLGQLRLADTYCERGTQFHLQKEYDKAIADHEKSLEYQTGSSGCDCDSYNPLAWLYYERGEYLKAWDVVKRAQKIRKRMDPELMKKLESVP